MRIAITFPNHWAIKNILHSGVAARVQEVAQIVGIADPSRIPHLEKLTSELGLQPIEWHAYSAPQETSRLTRIRRLQKYFVYESRRIESERLLQQKGKRTRFELLASAVLRPVARSPLSRFVGTWLAGQRTRLTPTVEIPQADLLFTTNPVDFREDPLIKAAQQAGTPVVTMIPSWDNLSTKGVLFSDFDSVVVWNEVMRDEVLGFLPKLQIDQVPVVGIPRFAVYESEVARPDNRKRILFANTATTSCPDQPAVARHLAEALESGDFGPAELIIRCHPHDDPSDYAFLREYPNVKVWPESATSYGVQTVPPADDLTNLRDMLQSADVCVNCASTIVLDAAANDVPIVSVAYDGDRQLPEAASVRKFYEFTHQFPYIASGAGDFAYDREALVLAVQSALRYPEVRRAQRAELALLATQGQPDARLADALLSCVGPIRRAA